MAKIRRGKNLKHWKSHRPLADQGKLRIVGGKFRGRQISYSGDPVTRPMKDNIREAVFNLIGGYIKGKVAFDLFGGTGAMGLEAISRGASQAVIIERHIPTVRIIKQNVQVLELEGVAEVVSGDSFFWGRQFIKQKDTWPTEPWVVLCCPPYDFYIDRWEELQTMIEAMFQAAPQQSVFVVESDDRFDTDLLPEADAWEVRQYAPARVAIYKKGEM
ncbi:RsmD family RNA methyltransferase [bacterium]|nr:RsmD family RNA methyltransferase [bacterium]